MDGTCFYMYIFYKRDVTAKNICDINDIKSIYECYIRDFKHKSYVKMPCMLPDFMFDFL